MRKSKNAAGECICLYNLDPDFFDNDILAGDETWLHHYTR